MKKTFLFAALMAVATLVGCNDSEESTEKTGNISVTPNSISLSGYSSSEDVAVMADGSWTATSNASWITFSMNSGYGDAIVTIMADANSDNSSRSAEVLFTSGSQSATVAVSQGASGSLGGSFSIDIEFTSIDAISANVYYTTTDDSQEYIYATFKTGLLEGSYSKDADKMAAIIEIYNYYGTMDSFLLSGSSAATLSGLYTSTDYTVYAFAINAFHDAAASDLYTADFTTITPEVSSEYNEWLGTWTLTSTTSELSGRPLSLDIVFTDDDGIAYPGKTYSIYGWDISKLRHILPLPATFSSSTKGLSINSINEMYYEDGYTYAYYPICYISGGYYLLDADFTAMTGAFGSSNQSATISCSSGTYDDTAFTTANVVLLATDGTNYYSFYNDDTLGFQDYEMLVGPFTLTKISDDETVPDYVSAQRVPGFDNVVLPVVKAFNSEAASIRSAITNTLR